MKLQMRDGRVDAEFEELPHGEEEEDHGVVGKKHKTKMSSDL